VRLHMANELFTSSYRKVFSNGPIYWLLLPLMQGPPEILFGLSLQPYASLYFGAEEVGQGPAFSNTALEFKP
jgi:hypothetical protein